MPHCSSELPQPLPIPRSVAAEPWHSFADILRRLHQERIYIHPEQLAEFFLRHGLPVDPAYVPPHLQETAERINRNYQGDMARLDTQVQVPQLFGFE